MSNGDTGVLAISLGNEYISASFVTNNSVKNVTEGQFPDFKTIISYRNNKFYYSNLATNVSLAFEKDTCRNFFLNLLEKETCHDTNLNSFQLFCKYLYYIFQCACKITPKETIKQIYLFFPYWASDEFRCYLKTAVTFKLGYSEDDVLLGTFPYPMRAFLSFQKTFVDYEEFVLIVDFGASNTEFFIMNVKDNETIYLHDFYVLNFGGNDVTNIIANILEKKLTDERKIDKQTLDDVRLKRAFWEGADKTKEVLMSSATIPFNPQAITHIDVQSTIRETDIINDESYKKVKNDLSAVVNSFRKDLKPTKFAFVGLASNLKFFADDIRQTIKTKYSNITEVYVNSTKDFKMESCNHFIQQSLKRRKKYQQGSHMKIYKIEQKRFCKPVNFEKIMKVPQGSLSLKPCIKEELKSKVEETNEVTPEFDIEKLQNEAVGVIIEYNKLIKELKANDYEEIDEGECDKEDAQYLKDLIADIRSKAAKIAKSKNAEDLLQKRQFANLKSK